MHYNYRLIQYCPNIVVDNRFTIGALVEYKKEVFFVPNPVLPPQTYLGDQTFYLMQLGITRLAKTEWKTINQHPENLGPHFLFETIRNIPLSVVDTVAWVGRIFDVI